MFKPDELKKWQIAGAVERFVADHGAVDLDTITEALNVGKKQALTALKHSVKSGRLVLRRGTYSRPEGVQEEIFGGGS